MNNPSIINPIETQTSSPATKHTRAPRGKISRLPRHIREELNTRLDDGQDSTEILQWLNNLPRVRILIERHYNGIPVSPQNLSAWRNGGYQEWLHLAHFFDSAIQMREQIQLMQKEISDSNPGEVPRSMADYMLTYLSVRFAAFMNKWDGSPSADHNALLKTASIIIKMQAAVIHAERATLELPELRHKALRAHIEHAMTTGDLRDHQLRNDALEDAEEARKMKRQSKPKTPSSPIKVNKGSRKKPASSPEPNETTEPAVIENVNFTPPAHAPTVPPSESTPNSAIRGVS